jgi:hypothetical protein
VTMDLVKTVMLAIPTLLRCGAITSSLTDNG